MVCCNWPTVFQDYLFRHSVACTCCAIPHRMFYMDSIPRTSQEQGVPSRHYSRVLLLLNSAALDLYLSKFSEVSPSHFQDRNWPINVLHYTTIRVADELIEIRWVWKCLIMSAGYQMRLVLKVSALRCNLCNSARSLGEKISCVHELLSLARRNHQSIECDSNESLILPDLPYYSPLNNKDTAPA